jgi:hypothetical protein
MSTSVHTQSTGSTPPAHQAKPKAHDKPAHETAPADLFASLLALVGQAPALADAATDGTTDLSQDGTSQDGAGGTDKRGSLLFAGGPLSLAGTLLPGNTPSAALSASLTGRQAEPRLTLEGFTAVEGHETLPTAALEAGLANGTETGKRSGPAPAFAWRNTPGAAQAAQATATQFGGAQAPMSWQRVPNLAPDSTLSAPGGLTAPRATVALDERFAPQFQRATDGTVGPSLGALTSLEDGRADTPAGLLPSGGAARQGGDGLGAANAPGTVVAGAGDAGGLGSSTGDANAQQGQSTPEQTDAQNPAGLADEPTEIGHWGTGALRHASLRVGEDAATAIDIQLKVQGQQVDVNFTTDSPEARDALREQASAALSELLQQSGLGLGGVSVGGQGLSRDDASRGQGAGPSTVQLGQGRRTGHESEGSAPARPRTDGSRPLDVFA